MASPFTLVTDHLYWSWTDNCTMSALVCKHCWKGPRMVDLPIGVEVWGGCLIRYSKLKILIFPVRRAIFLFKTSTHYWWKCFTCNREHGPKDTFSPREHEAGSWIQICFLKTMEYGPKGKFSHRDYGAWLQGQIFSSGPWSTVPRANFLLGTMEHGPEGKYTP